MGFYWRKKKEEWAPTPRTEKERDDLGGGGVNEC